MHCLTYQRAVNRLTKCSEDFIALRGNTQQNDYATKTLVDKRGSWEENLEKRRPWLFLPALWTFPVCVPLLLLYSKWAWNPSFNRVVDSNRLVGLLLIFLGFMILYDFSRTIAISKKKNRMIWGRRPLSVKLPSRKPPLLEKPPLRLMFWSVRRKRMSSTNTIL